MGLKEFFTITMFYFRLYPQYSNIPFFQLWAERTNLQYRARMSSIEHVLAVTETTDSSFRGIPGCIFLDTRVVNFVLDYGKQIQIRKR